MTTEQKQLVQTSFEKVKPIADIAAALFHGFLFKLDPRLERLFMGDLEDQGRKLMRMIGLAVRGLDHLDEILPLLSELGEGHAGYGVAERDYETVRAALLATLQRGLGDEFTPAVREAWIAVYELLAETMKAGAREALIVTAIPMNNEATTCTGGDRNGWRGYFPAAARKTLKGRETEMQPESNYETLTGRFATTIVTLVCALFLFASAAQASTFTVTTTADNGDNSNPTPGSLRKAIYDAILNNGGTIHFNIPGAGVHTITLLSEELLPLTRAITIDGYTQPGSSVNTQQVGSNAVPLIEINGSSVNDPNGNNGFTIAAPNCVISGLIINRFAGAGISIFNQGSSYKGASAVVTGCFIGTNAAGNAALPNGGGINIFDAPDNVIGGLFVSARNLISGQNGQSGVGIYIDGSHSTGNLVLGNLIGTDKSGSGNLANTDGIIITNSASNNTIGNTIPSTRNIISGNANYGIQIHDANQNLIEGNYIGTDALGTSQVGNSTGIWVFGSSAGNKIGDTVAGAGNVISGNQHEGIFFGQTSSGNHVIANFIGTKADGTGALGNGKVGVELSDAATNNTIGGTASGSGNVIAFNGAGGVISSASTGNAIEQNSMFSNTGPGIDLIGLNGPDANDLNDADSGPNNLQNYPVITSAFGNGFTNITGTLNSEANKLYRIELFANSQCNASGHGDGKSFITSTYVTTSGNNANFSLSFLGFYLNQFITATATDPNGNTSEFSQCKLVSAAPLPPGSLAFSAATYSVGEGAGVATITVSRTGGSGGAVSVNYQTNGGTAAPNSDYTPVSGTLSWNDGDAANKTFTIPIVNDSLDEPDETIGLTLNNPAGGATLGNPSTATLTITDNDPPVVLNISNVSQAEGDSGTTSFVFNVTTADNSGQTMTVNYSTIAGGTATAGSDYQTVSGTLSFAPGEASKTVTVPVNGDTQEEPDETFFVQLSNPMNATLGKALGVGTIVNDDAAPTPTPTPTPTPLPTPISTPGISISDVSLAEGNSGTTSFDFNVTLSTASSQTVNRGLLHQRWRRAHGK